MKTLLGFLCTMGLASFPLASGAEILPYVDDTVSTGKLKDLNEDLTVLYYGFDRGLGNNVSDPSNPNSLPGQSDIATSPNIKKNVVYFPWTELMVVKNPNAPGKSLGFAYNHKGALLSATLRATADWKALKKQLGGYAQKLQQEGIDPKTLEVKPIPVRSGVYKATLVMKSGNEIAVGNEVSQANPRGNVALSVAFNKNMADIVMTGMHTGAAVGWNYTYVSPMAIVPFRAEIEIDWKSVLDEMKRDFKLKTAVTSMAITNMTRKLVEKKVVKINIAGGEDHQKTEAAVWDIAKILMARTFKANHPSTGSVPQLDPPAAGGGGQSFLASGAAPQSLMGGLAGFSLFNPSGVTGSLSMVTNNSLESVTEKISIVSAPYKFVEFNAGLQIGGLCDTQPQYFAYEGPGGQILRGCSSQILPDEAAKITIAADPISTPIDLKTNIADASEDGKVESVDVDDQTKSELENMLKNQ
jgi:hypothetical protein